MNWAVLARAYSAKDSGTATGRAGEGKGERGSLQGDQAAAGRLGSEKLSITGGGSHHQPTLTAPASGQAGVLCFQETRYPHSSRTIRAIIGEGGGVSRGAGNVPEGAPGEKQHSLIGYTAIPALSHPVPKIPLKVFIPSLLMRTLDEFYATSWSHKILIPKPKPLRMLNKHPLL